ncbi:hypothetical protein GWA97_00385 [Flavobacterium sp. LaA7.5]|nr:hypothetical protein [Flavobacterium salilacus subsp. altitudinum]
MTKKIILLLLFLSLCVSINAQRRFDQYSLEAGYGLGISGAPGITEFSHFEIGFRYMVDEYWGVKFDYGSDRFRTDGSPELGTDYQRYSVQGVYNLGRTLALTNYANGYFNMLAHGGLGYSSLKNINKSGTDNIGNVIVGITPQLWLSDDFALTLDTSLILNFSQHYDFDGTYPDGKPTNNAFVGNVINASIGITYYFGRNKNGSDWN